MFFSFLVSDIFWFWFSLCLVAMNRKERNRAKCIIVVVFLYVVLFRSLFSYWNHRNFNMDFSFFIFFALIFTHMCAVWCIVFSMQFVWWMFCFVFLLHHKNRKIFIRNKKKNEEWNTFYIPTVIMKFVWLQQMPDAFSFLYTLSFGFFRYFKLSRPHHSH